MAKRSRQAKASSAATKTTERGDGAEARRIVQRAKDLMKQVERTRVELDDKIERLEEVVELIHVPHIGPPSTRKPKPPRPKPPRK